MPDAREICPSRGVVSVSHGTRCARERWDSTHESGYAKEVAVGTRSKCLKGIG